MINRRDHALEASGTRESHPAIAIIPDGGDGPLVAEYCRKHLDDFFGIAEEDAEDEVVLPELVGFRRNLLEFGKIVQEAVEGLPQLVLSGSI